MTRDFRGNHVGPVPSCGVQRGSFNRPGFRQKAAEILVSRWFVGNFRAARPTITPPQPLIDTFPTIGHSAFMTVLQAIRRVEQGAEPRLAGGDDDESGVDRGAIADGQLELRFQPAPERKVQIVRTDTNGG